MDEVLRRNGPSPAMDPPSAAPASPTTRRGGVAPSRALPLQRPASRPAQPLPVLPGRAQPAPKDDVTPLCAKCAALCCRYVALPIDNPESAHDYDNVRWYLMHENIHVFVDDGQWYVGFASRCKHLREDNLCGIYETRPRVCRGYDTDNCEWHGAEYRYEHLFTSAEQLRRHAEEELGRSILFKPRPRRLKVKRRVDGTKKVQLPLA